MKLNFMKILQICIVSFSIFSNFCIFANLLCVDTSQEQFIAYGTNIKLQNSNLQYQNQFLLNSEQMLNIPVSYNSNLIVEDMWARPTMGQNRNTAIYFKIINNFKHDLVLNAAKIDSFKSRVVELHDSFVDENGVSRMRSVANLVVPKQSSIELKPGGTHVMVIGMDKALVVGDQFLVDLYFSDNSKITVQCTVKKL